MRKFSKDEAADTLKNKSWKHKADKLEAENNGFRKLLGIVKG